MAKPIPKWIQKRYGKLWNKLKDKQFTYDKARKILKKGEKDTSAFFFELRKAGWIEAKLNQKDARKRLYKLKSPNEVFKEMK